MQFADLRLPEPILRALASEGYSTATPVQAQAIPFALAGRDVLGSAQTGTGKTAAFAIPVLQRLISVARPSGAPKRVRCLVLCPTRELATQIDESFQAYGKHVQFRHTVVFGGMNQRPQVDALRRGIDVLIATPGRLLDLVGQGHADLSGVEVLVLDEADRMLDMGFIHDIRKLVSRLPATRQTMLFSATMPPEIRRLAESLLRNPANVQVASVSATAERIDESVYFVTRSNKPALLAHLVNHLPMSRAIVFTRTKHGADRVVRQLHTRGIHAEAIHGNKSQNARQRALCNFRDYKTPVLVATDIASRGIDVDGISHVVNYDMTHEPETYVHRIGRTARAGAAGAAVSLCDPEEMQSLKAIEKLIRRPIPIRTDHPHHNAGAPTHESRSAGYAQAKRPAELHRHSHAPSAQHGARPSTNTPARRRFGGTAQASAPRPRHPIHGHARPAHFQRARKG